MSSPHSIAANKSSTLAERRRSLRQTHVAPATVSSPTGGHRIEVLSMDLSKHGVRLQVGQPIASGTFQRLEMEASDLPVVREVRILSCRLQPDGSYQVHAEFC
jgi:hypothetical protein